MFIKTLIALLLTASFAMPSFAAEITDQEQLRIAIGGWSKHYDADSITNETHNILGIEAKGYSAGYFKNSYGRDTYYIAKNWKVRVLPDINVTASLGVNRGYRKCYGDDDSGANFCPHGYIGIEYDKYRVVPSIKFQPGVFIFSPEIKF